MMQDTDDYKPTLANCEFVVEPSGQQYKVMARNIDNTVQPICITNSTCVYANHATAILIASALRKYFEKMGA